MNLVNKNECLVAERLDDGLAKLAKAAELDDVDRGLKMLTVDASQPVSRLATEIGQILSDAPIFRFGDDYVTVDIGTGEMLPMTANRFCSWVESYLFVTMARSKGPEVVTMRREHAAMVLASDNFKAQVREVKSVNKVRLPVWRGSDEIEVDPGSPFWLGDANRLHVELLPVGYDRATKTLTVDTVPYDDDLSLHDAEMFFGEVLSGFPWVKEDECGSARSLGVHISAMLGVFCKSMFRDGTIRPMIIYNGNQPGSGKSLLMRMALAPVHGAPAEKSKPSNDELEKVLGVVAMGRRPYLVLDDVSSLHSHALNCFINSPVYEPRVLGQSRDVVCPNVTQVFATGNQLSLAEDLVRRSLVVDLFEPGKAVERTFPNEITPDWLVLRSTRARFLSALWAVVRHWNEQGLPANSKARHTSAPIWAQVIGGIVHCFKPELKPWNKRDYELGGDESGAALEALLCAVASDVLDSGAEFKSGDLIEEAESRGLLDAITGHCKDPRKALGHRLKKMRGRIFTDSNGRSFEFGRSAKSFGAVYPIRFLG